MSQTFKSPFVPFDDIEIGDNISDQSKTRMEGVSDEFCLSLETQDGASNLLQPLVVREGGPSRKTGKRRVVLDCGYRRYGAIRRLRAGLVPGQKTKAGSWAQVPVRYVKGDETDQDSRNLIENLQRLNLDAYEEAAAMLAFLDKHKGTQAMLAARISKSEPYVSQRLAMLRGTTEEVRQALRDGVITPTHIREILDLPKDKQPEFIAALRAQAAQGKYASVADVKDDIAAKAPKATNNKKKTGRKGTSYDQEKITSAKDAYPDKKFAPRPRPAVVEGLGTLVMRERRHETEKTKYQIQAIEWVLGIRDGL